MKVGKDQENLNVTMACRYRPPSDSLDAIWFHLKAIWGINKPDEANLFCVKLVLRELEVESGCLRPLEKLLKVHYVLFVHF